ncbi:hypothetical protein [Lentzea sp. NPDC051838]|uniref:hypothetical protein n=1 Tax=Lentzea sp. NPDC051838 TaxID=3154849 RepID=UPI0034491444
MRRSEIAVAAVAGLVLTGVTWSFVARPADEAPPPVVVPTLAEEPVLVEISRSGAEGWTLVSATHVDQLTPSPATGPVEPSRSCDEPYRMLNGIAHAKSPTINVRVISKPFREVQVTDVRISHVRSWPYFTSPSYLYHCTPQEPRGRKTFDSQYEVTAHEHFSWKARRQDDTTLPWQFSGQNVQEKSVSATVLAHDKRYEWKVVVEYVHQGRTSTIMRLADQGGELFVSGPGPREEDAHANRVWCGPPHPRWGDGSC